MENWKKCSGKYGCDKSFEATSDNFYKNSSGSFGLSSMCKECEKKKNKKHRKFQKSKPDFIELMLKRQCKKVPFTARDLRKLVKDNGKKLGEYGDTWMIEANNWEDFDSYKVVGL